ncbi:MAG: MarR family transcriptional regulator [Candidatus Micrarchaeota archaeon]|nr:MarR family transcriptional regulator [Candidatus Micrarchaeota archaeon]
MNSLRVLTIFFGNPYRELYLREIARKLKMSPATVLRVLKVLENEGLLTRRDEKNASYFKASMTNEFKALKVAFTMSIIEGAGVAELISKKSRGLSCILLYGSAARGEDDSKSDYDLLVVAAECDAKALEISEILGRESTLQSYTISEWKEVSKKNRAFYIEVISSSITLYGNKPVMD